MSDPGEDEIARLAEELGRLAASRARIAAAADEERRRVVRDLHDGAQQRLVQAIVTLKLLRLQLGGSELMDEALAQAEQANVELRELAHGILPAVLARGGLAAAVATLASRAPAPLELDVCRDRFDPAIEATAYFVVAESLKNVADRAEVTARVEDGTLRVEIRVDGACPDDRELVGLADRLAVLDGRLEVDGTRIAAAIPLP
jgi:signal transduction histidine kinase